MAFTILAAAAARPAIAQSVYPNRSITMVVNFAADGAIRVIDSSGTKRSAALPFVPTFAELGYPYIFGDSWQIVMAPAGTSTGVVAKLSAAIDEVMRTPAFVEKLAKLGAETAAASPAEITRLLGDEHRRWGAVVAEHRITVD